MMDVTHRSDEAEQAALHAEVRRALQSRSHWPVFSPLLEDRFEADTASARVKHIVRAGIMMMIVANAYRVVNWFALNDVFDALLILNTLGAVLYLGLLVVTQWVRLGATTRETLHGVFLLLYLLLFVSTTTASHAPESGYDAMTYMLFIVAVNTVLRLRFIWALPFSIVAVAGIAVGVSLHGSLPQSVKILVDTSSLTAAAFTLYANYAMEVSQRQAYLLTLERELAAEALEGTNAILSTLSATDWLTGVANRRAFEVQLERDWGLAARTGAAMALIMIDVDQFKSYNDRHGHPAGDACLRRLAALMRKHVRGSDTVARYGGEEFAVILPMMGLDDAAVMGERIRQAVQALAMPHAGTGSVITISVGVAVATPSGNASKESLVQAADQALYRAKAAGRNIGFVARHDDAGVLQMTALQRAA